MKYISKEGFKFFNFLYWIDILLECFINSLHIQPNGNTLISKKVILLDLFNLSGSSDLPISSKTSDPSNILVSINLMYKIKPEFIYDLYLDYPS